MSMYSEAASPNGRKGEKGHIHRAYAREENLRARESWKSGEVRIPMYSHRTTALMDGCQMTVRVLGNSSVIIEGFPECLVLWK
jgi:hypothetical protein